MTMTRVVCSLLFIILLSAVSCSSASSDAKRAAALKLESINYSRQGDVGKAEEAYLEADAIMQRYRDTNDYASFSESYSKAMKANKNQRNG